MALCKARTDASVTSEVTTYTTMRVTEIATLNITPPHRWVSPDTQAFFGTLANQQAEWSGYPLRFFEDTTDTQVVYLITGWKSVSAHYEWIASEQNQKLLERAKGLIDVAGLEHAEVDSEVADAQFVVWKQWELREEETIEKGPGVGVVLDKEPEGRVVCSLKGCSSKEEEGTVGKDAETKRMRRLELKL